MLSLFNLTEGYTLLVVASGALLLGLVSGIVGCLALVKKHSLLADAISHASLPGIVLAFILAGAKTHSVLLAGAAVAGWIAALQIVYLVRKGQLKQDSSLSLMLSVYFGFGMVLLSMIQHHPGSAQAGIETFLFGEAATMLITDVKLIGIIAGAVLLVLLLFWKELFIVAFDPAYAASTGLPVVKLEVLFTFIVVCTIVAGLQTVGVVLMSAMLVIPAAAARQWTNSMRIMILLSMFFGGLSGVAGSLMSSIVPKLPTGPTIIIIVSTIAFFSFFFAPKRGLVWSYLRKQKRQNTASTDVVLKMLYLLAIQHENPNHGHSVNIFQSFFPLKKNLDKVLCELKAKGLADETKPGFWAITDNGNRYIEKNPGIHTVIEVKND